MAADNFRRRRRVRAGQVLVPERELEEAYRQALDLLVEAAGPDDIGDYLEFGVCSGASMACMHRASRDRGLHLRLFGFDSFRGLPSSARSDGVWRPGEFSWSEREARRFLTRQGIDWSRTTLVRGWFDDTLTLDFATAHDILPGVVMVDCDAYPSASTALRFCAPLIQDRAIFFFDDWHSGSWHPKGDLAARGQGEKRAFDEMLAHHPNVSAEELPRYSRSSRVFLIRSQ